MVVGVITTKHLITQAVVIISSYGLVFWLKALKRAVLSRRPITFLELVMTSEK